jgi:PKHD-type hydroxylase
VGEIRQWTIMKFGNPLVKFKLNDHDLLIIKNAITEDNLEESEASNQDLRSCKIKWIENSNLRSLLLSLCHQANVNAEWNLQILGGEGIQYTLYNEEDHYDWHVDAQGFLKSQQIGMCSDSHIRKISLTIFLSDPEEYEGGELELELFGPLAKKRSVKFKEPKGTVIFFPSDTWHKVNPIKSGTRKSLVTWFGGGPYV